MCVPFEARPMRACKARFAVLDRIGSARFWWRGKGWANDFLLADVADNT